MWKAFIIGVFFSLLSASRRHDVSWIEVITTVLEINSLSHQTSSKANNANQYRTLLSHSLYGHTDIRTYIHTSSSEIDTNTQDVILNEAVYVSFGTTEREKDMKPSLFSPD